MILALELQTHSHVNLNEYLKEVLIGHTCKIHQVMLLSLHFVKSTPRYTMNPTLRHRYPSHV